MTPSVAQKLLALNRTFYEQVAAPFAQSRSRPQPGFTSLLDHLPQPCPHLLELGCGEGRLGRFLLERGAIGAYTGVDFSPALLAHAAATTPGTFFERDISQPGCLDGLGQFPAIASLAVLQHIPGAANRVQLLREMKNHLEAGGRILLSTWQFLDSPRQQRKIVDWSTVGLSQEQVETSDYLLTWQRGEMALRYLSYLNLDTITQLAQQAGLHLHHHFYSDGQEGNLSLYAILS